MRLTRLGIAVACALTAMSMGASPANAVTHDTIEGTGSSWAANAVNQWVADVQAQGGLRVVYTSPGSAQGRKDFSFGNTDFAISDIGYQGSDPKTGADDSSSRKYAYLPIVGGGTSFPYNLKKAGKRVTNLRLSGQTLAKIFTNQITNWDDPQITKDNNGSALPSKQIIPVVHSEGAGSTAQFTQWLADQYPSLWTPFNNGSSAFTEYYPRAGAQIARDQSDGVMSYVTSDAGDGAIGYDEYSYPLSAGFPVAKIENKAGYFTLPTQFNDAVALTQAAINHDPTSPNYLLQDLHNVYVYTDPRTYPLSSYSYAVIPIGNKSSTPTAETRATTAKRQTLADFLSYSVCDGQQEMGPIGYSSLPLNLVQASFGQINKLHSADPGVVVNEKPTTSCKNPTFDAAHPKLNKLAEIAPQPAACDKSGQGPCTDDTSTGAANGNPNNNGGNGGGSNGGGSNGGGSNGGTTNGGTTNGGSTNGGSTNGGSTNGGSTNGGSTNGGTQNGGAGKTTGNSAGPSVSVTRDPVTGQLSTSSNGATAGDVTSNGAGDAAPNPSELAAYQPPSSATPYAILAVLLLASVLIAPPLLARYLRRRK